VFGHIREQLEFEANAWHEKIGLITGLSLKGYGVIAGQLPSKPVSYKSDLGRSNTVERHDDGANQKHRAYDD
jgi:hypothetical protein